MGGASEHTRRVTALNANWVADINGDDGTFQLLIVTDDDTRHTVTTTPASLTALIALSQAGTVLLWDPEHRTLIAANIVGQWIDEDWGSTYSERDQ